MYAEHLGVKDHNFEIKGLQMVQGKHTHIWKEHTHKW